MSDSPATNGYGPHVETDDRQTEWLLDDDLELQAELALRRRRLDQIDRGEDRC